MIKPETWIEILGDRVGRLSIGIVALICLGISIAGFFNYDVFTFIKPTDLEGTEASLWRMEKQHSLVFALVALVGIYLASSVVKKFERLSAKVDELESMTNAYFQGYQNQLDERLEKISDELDPTLNCIVGHYVTDLASSLRLAIKNKTIKINDLNEFRMFYRRALQSFPDSNICATSLASRNYFWSDPLINEAIEEFTRGGGKMKRIFFLPAEEDLNDPDVRAVLNCQRRIGVDVRVAKESSIPPHLRLLFVVDTIRPIAWEVQTLPSDDRIRDITARVDEEAIASYRETFQKLEALPDVKPYTPQLQSL